MIVGLMIVHITIGARLFVHGLCHSRDGVNRRGATASTRLLRDTISASACVCVCVYVCACVCVSVCLCVCECVCAPGDSGLCAVETR